MKHSHIPYPLTVLGRSTLGAPVHSLISHQSSPCDLLIIAGIHGEESDTTITLSRALRSVAHLAPSLSLVLCANPDGAAMGTRGNANGVDLNRNFPTDDWQATPTTCRWHYDQTETTEIHTGSAPGSEAETQILISLISRLRPTTVLSLHGPIGCIDDPDASAAGQWLAEQTALPLVSDIGYPTPGSLGTWAAEQESGPHIVTWEFPCQAIEQLSRSILPTLQMILSGESPFTSGVEVDPSHH